MPIPLGILAAAGFRPTAGGSYELIETITVSGSSTTSVTFSNLNTYSTTYQHLQIRLVANQANTDNVGNTYLRFNGVSTTSYVGHILYGTGGSVTSSNSLSQTSIPIATVSRTNTSGIVGSAVIDILDPYEAKNKTVRALSGMFINTNSFRHFISLQSGLYLSTDSISSATILSDGSSFTAGSRFSIYGLKGTN